MEIVNTCGLDLLTLSRSGRHIFHLLAIHKHVHAAGSMGCAPTIERSRGGLREGLKRKSRAALEGGNGRAPEETGLARPRRSSPAGVLRRPAFFAGEDRRRAARIGAESPTARRRLEGRGPSPRRAPRRRAPWRFQIGLEYKYLKPTKLP